MAANNIRTHTEPDFDENSRSEKRGKFHFWSFSKFFGLLSKMVLTIFQQFRQFLMLYLKNRMSVEIRFLVSTSSQDTERVVLSFSIVLIFKALHIRLYLLNVLKPLARDLNSRGWLASKF